jgi:hypothetical protein
MKWSNFSRLFIATLAFTLTAAFTVSEAADSTRLTFTTHAAFFSTETHQAKPIDPQVFVRDPAAPAATGPQGIRHVAGVRPALIDQDPGATPLVNANGEPLGFDLADWLGAKGVVTITRSARGKIEVSARFTHLRPGGYYSLFENHFDQQPIGFTPLDETGKTNNFVASKIGSTRVTVVAPQPLTHANAVLLVYHSDKMFHSEQRGDPGVNAHHQLIARIPE